MADEGAAPPPDGQQAKMKRKECERCSLPPEPLLTRGRIVLLQHPIEAKRRLTTVPLLQLCLADCHVIVGRKYKPGVHEAIAEALAGASRGEYPLLLLFPGEGSQYISDAAAALGLGEQKPAEAGDGGARAGPSPRDGDGHAPAGGEVGEPGRRPEYVLLVIDGTWQQAKEMFKALAPTMLPPSGPALRVQLPLPPPVAQPPAGGGAPTATASGADDDGEPGSSGQHGGPGRQAPAEASCLLRKEPAVGCVTTCEAVAQALGALEGPAVRAAVMAPLLALAAQQAQWNPSLRARLEGVPEAAYTTSKRRYRMGSGTVPG